MYLFWSLWPSFIAFFKILYLSFLTQASRKRLRPLHKVSDTERLRVDATRNSHTHKINGGIIMITLLMDTRFGLRIDYLSSRERVSRSFASSGRDKCRGSSGKRTEFRREMRSRSDHPAAPPANQDLREKSFPLQLVQVSHEPVQR